MSHWMTMMTQVGLRAEHWLSESVRGSEALLLPLVHDISLTALAAAVLTLGLVMLLELRSLARLRRSVDSNLSRLFEQLDLLRFDQAQLLDVQGSRGALAPRAAMGVVHAVATSRPPSQSTSVESTTTGAHATGPIVAVLDQRSEPLSVGGLESRTSLGTIAAGEARLLASLAQARARRAEAARAEGARATS